MSDPPVSLEVLLGKAKGTMIQIEDELMIGRHAEGLGRLADDPEISRMHARVSVDTSGFCAIEDLGSTNGTFVNGLRISTRQTLSDGDTVELGDTTLVVRRGEGQAPPEADAPADADTSPEGDEGPAPVESAAGIPKAVEHPLDEALVPAAAAAPEEPASTSQDAAAGVADPPAPTEAYEPGAVEPEAPAAPDPFGAPADAPADAYPPPLSLWVEVDFGARTTLIRLDDHSPPIRLAHIDGTWRQVSPAD